jgi:uncharacterized membrane protein YgcG
MIKKTLLCLILFFSFPGYIFGQGQQPYEINDFQVEVSINQDTSITVEEEIAVNFNQARHGIFRVVPVVYTVNGRTLRTDFSLISVQDNQGNKVPVEVSSRAQSKELRIGDPDKTITGNKTYVIKYSLLRVIQQYEDYDEFYWNVTGPEWDVPIKQASIIVNSKYADITQTECFAGLAGSKQENCQVVEESGSVVSFQTSQPINPGSDFTVVVGLDQDNQLNFPGPVATTVRDFRDNLGYGLAVLPLLAIIGFWWKKGRDKRYLSDNVYYQPDDQQTKKVNPLARKLLPMVYHPIDNLTPAQVGTIVDERINLRDVIAEIIELGRLGYLAIERIEKKSILQKDDYRLRKKKNTDEQLADYQQFLMEKLFDGQEEVKISDLKNEFYQHLEKFKKKVYASLVDQQAFPSSPEKVRQKWVGIAFLISFLFGALVVRYMATTGNIGPLFVVIPSAIVAIILAGFMPRKTAWGYSLHRQAKGLRYYLDKGKWRQEIAEKHLFLQEVLPLAIALDVVDQLAKDMAELGVQPPEYVHGFTTANLHRQMSSFNTYAASNIASTPSGKSSWSGGSGFSGGGSAGGGFGGGGGGSW